MTMKEEQQPNSLGQTLENHICIKLGLLSIVQKPIRLCLFVLYRSRSKKLLCIIIFGPKNFWTKNVFDPINLLRSQEPTFKVWLKSGQ